MFKKTKKHKSSEQLNAEYERRYTPIAYQIIKLIIDADLPIGPHAVNEKDAFNKVAQDVIQIMLDNKVNYMDRHFLFQLALKNEAKQIIDRYTGKIEYKNKEGEITSVTLGRDTVSTIVMQPFLMVQNIVNNSLENNFNRLINKVLGKDILDLTVNDIDLLIKNNLSTA